jgi:hypothetical protein
MFVALALAMPIATASAQEGDDARYEALVRDAVAAYEARDPERALAAFQRAHEIHPSPRVLRGIAMCHVELGRWADAYVALRDALAIDEGERALGPELRASVEEVLLPVVRAHVALWVLPEGVQVSVDGAEVRPDAERVIAVDAGRREVTARSADGRTARATIEVRASHVGPLPLALPEPPPVAAAPPPQPSRVIAASTPVRPVPSSVTVVSDAGLGDYEPHDVRTRFSIWAHGTLGAWQGGAEYSPAAGFGLTMGLMTAFRPELAMGGQIEGTWAGLLDACGPYASGGTILRTSETCAWFRMSIRIAIEARSPDAPISVVLAGGPGLGFRGTQQRDELGSFTQSSRADTFVALDLGLRWYAVDDVLFLGAEVRSAIGTYADVGGAIQLGIQVP